MTQEFFQAVLPRSQYSAMDSRQRMHQSYRSRNMTAAHTHTHDGNNSGRQRSFMFAHVKWQPCIRSLERPKRVSFHHQVTSLSLFFLHILIPPFKSKTRYRKNRYTGTAAQNRDLLPAPEFAGQSGLPFPVAVIFA